MRLRTILLSLLALIVILIGAAFTVLITTDYSKYRGAIEAKVTEATGRAFKIGSDFHVEIGLSPTLVANDVEFANASWGSRPQMIVVKQFEVQINLLPLIFGNISVAQLKLVDANILLETDKRGRGNWEFETAGAPPATPPPAAEKSETRGNVRIPEIHDVYFEGVLLQFHDGQTNETRRFSLGHLSLSSTDRNAPLKLDINGTYNDFYFEIGGALGSANALGRRGAPSPIDITAKLGATDATLHVSGEFKQPLEARGYDLRVTATTSELAQVADFARDAHFGTFPLPKLGPLKADFHVTDVGPADAGTGGMPSLQAVKIDAGRPDLLRLQVGGKVRDAVALKGIALDATASGQEIGALSGLVLPGVPGGLPQLPALGPYKLAIKIADGADRISLPAARLDLGRDPQLKLSVSGAIRDPLAGKGYGLTVDGSVQDLAATAQLLKVALPIHGPATLTGRIADSGPQRYALTGLAIKAEGSDIGGSGSLSLAGARPAATVDLTSTMIDLGQIIQHNGQPAPAARQAPVDGRVFAADPLPLDTLTALDAELRYHAATIRTPGGPAFRDTTVAAALHDGTLSVQPISTTIGGGKITGDLSLQGKGGVAGLKLTVRGVSLGEIDREAPGQDLVHGGTVNADLEVKGTGASVRALMGSLNGTVFVSVGPGTFRSRYTDIVGLGGLMNLVSKSLPRLERTTLHCFVSRFDVTNGLAVSRVLVADTGRITLDGSGKIDLRDEKLDMGLDTHTKVTNLLSLMPPISVGGTLADPDFEPDIGAAAVGVIGNVVGDILRQPGNLIDSIFGTSGSPDQKICAAAYAKAGRTPSDLPGAMPAAKGTAPATPLDPASPPAPASPSAPAQPQPARPPAQRSPGDAIQDLGKGIQRGFHSLFGQ